MWLYILLGLVAVIALVLIVASLQPSQFKIARSRLIAASPNDLFPQVNDLKLMYGWSPWSEMDPNCRVDYTDPSAGVGAKQSWNGNNKVGEGSMEIIESRPHELVRYNLCFVRPFKCSNSVTMTLKPTSDQQTEVTWSMAGKNNFMGKLMCLFMNMDKMVGKDFEKGLATLERTVETSRRSAHVAST